MNIIRGKREPAEVAPADGVWEGGLSRRRVLGGPAALLVPYGMVGLDRGSGFCGSSACAILARDHLSCCG
jgi:hypothetical protein